MKQEGGLLYEKIFENIGFVTFPIYTLAGVIGSIPFIIYKGIFLFKNNRCK